MSPAPRPTGRAPAEMTHEQALGMLRRYSRVQWVPTVASTAVAGGAMVLVRRLLFSDSWSDATTYGVGFGLLLMAVYLVLDWRRVRRMPDTSGWQSLERAEILRREGPSVTLRSTRSRRTITALVRQAHHLQEGDPVWVGPSVTAGEQLALVRASAGPFGTPVLATFEPAEAGSSS